MISHLQLENIKTLSDSVTLQQDINGFQFIVVQHNKVNAAFSLHGGHLIHFQPTGQAPVIWVSKTALYNEQKAIRGGVPICWPWFGAAGVELGEGLPSHGFARVSKWSVENISESDAGVELSLTLTDSAETLKQWPYAFNLTLKATLTDTLNLQLITENKSDKPFYYRSALHTYLNVGDINSCLVTGLNNQYKNALNEGAIEQGNGSKQFTGPVDSVYDKAPADIIIKDTTLIRTLTVSNNGNDSDVVWSPGKEGAIAFADMPDDGYKTMLCVESTITHQQGVTVAPGETHILSTNIA